MDDLVVLGETKEELKRVLRYIKVLLKGLKLEVNSKTQIAQIKDGVDFVGYRTWYNNRLIRKRSLYKLKRVIKKYPEMSRIASYLSHSKRTNSLLYVVRQILKVAESFSGFIQEWLIKNNKQKVYYEIFQS